MTKVRNHRGSLAESMETLREVKDRAELLGIIQEELKPFHVDVQPDQVHIEPYCRDNRIGWDTWLITIDGYGVWGMSDGPIDADALTLPAPNWAEGLRNMTEAERLTSMAALNATHCGCKWEPDPSCIEGTVFRPCTYHREQALMAQQRR